jgi:hypothetical protein
VLRTIRCLLIRPECFRLVGKAEWMGGEANPRFVVTSLKAAKAEARHLYGAIYCACGEKENRIKECQLDLFADRTSAATMRANQLRLWFASAAYMLLCALRCIGLAHTQFAAAACGTIWLKLLKIGALVRISVRRVTVAMTSAFHGSTSSLWVTQCCETPPPELLEPDIASRTNLAIMPHKAMRRCVQICANHAAAEPPFAKTSLGDTAPLTSRRRS